MKNILLAFTLISLVNLALGQTNREKFHLLFQKNDTIKIKSLLVEWEKSNPNDPESYTSALNFYFSNYKQMKLSIDRKQTGPESLQLNDSTGKVAGYLNSNPDYRSDQLALAFKYIDKGIEKFPKRLDMRFGKCYVLKQIADYSLFTSEIIKTIEYSRIIKNDWYWTDNKKLDGAEHFMLESIQAYLKQLYDTQNDIYYTLTEKYGDAKAKEETRRNIEELKK